MTVARPGTDAPPQHYGACTWTERDGQACIVHFYEWAQWIRFEWYMGANDDEWGLA